MQYTPHDKYFDKAKKEGYRARSVYKLQEIQERFRVFRVGDSVLDLGAAPGSFLKYISSQVGASGRVIGADLKPIAPFSEKNIRTVVADVMDDQDLEAKLKSLGAAAFNAIVSDMAPNTSGIRFLDGGRSQELNERVIILARKYLKTGGNLVIKLLPGVEESRLIKPMKECFEKVRHIRPQAVRKTSGEYYLVGLKANTGRS